MRPPLPPQIESLFTRFPALSGFSVVGPDDVPDSLPRDAYGYNLFIGEVGFESGLNYEQCREIFGEIVSALSDLLSEEPSAAESLRGRTFARTLH